MMFRISLALVLLLPALAGAAQLSPQGTAEIDRYLQDGIGTTRVPGMVAVVVDKNGIVYEKAFGLMEAPKASPCPPTPSSAWPP